jgi:phenylacetate-coenzyme A ligase PaaK-like adenylate-forming protein
MSRRKLFLGREIYNHEKSDSLFLEAVKKNILYHKSNCREYEEILDTMDFHINDLTSMEDLYKLPSIPTMYLKTHYLSSMSKRRLLVKATSSGTSGTYSRIGYNFLSLFYGAVMAWKLLQFHGLFSLKRTNYILLGYEPHRSNETIITKTQLLSTFMAPAKQRVYALQYKDHGYEVNFDDIKNALDQYSRQKNPVRLIGFPYYTLFLLKELKKNQISYQLPKGSMVLLGGGWKGFYQEETEKETLFQMIREILGIEEENCREFFGAAEHPVLYCTCPNHHFHVSNYSRVIIRDVMSLEPVKNGQPGLVNLMTPMADSMPLTSIMTDDLGVLYDGNRCGCGIETPYLVILGRIGMKEIQTCAVNAADLLGE